MLSSLHLQNSTPYFHRAGASLIRLLSPQSKPVCWQRSAVVPLQRRRLRPSGKQLVAYNPRSLLNFPRRFLLLILPTKSCLRYSRKPCNSLTQRSERALLLLRIPHLLTLGGWRSRQPRRRPMTGLPDRPQAVGSRHSSALHKEMFIIELRKTARKSIYHRRVHSRTQRSALSSDPETRLIAPLPHSFMGPHNCLYLSLQTFGSA